jgi:5'-nucleotidase
VDALTAYMARHKAPAAPFARGAEPEDAGGTRVRRVGGTVCPTGASLAS